MKTPLVAAPSLTAGSGLAFSTNSATRYLRLAGQHTPYLFGYVPETTEGDWRTTVDDDGFIDDFAVYIAANTRTTATTFTLMVNGVSSGYTATVGAGVTGWVGASGGPVAVNESDLLSVRMVTGTGGGSLTLDMIESTFEAGDGSTLAHFIVAGDYGFNQSPSTSRVGQGVNAFAEGNSFASGWAGAVAWNSWTCRAGLDATAESIRVDIPVNSASVDCSVELFKNDAATGLKAIIPAGTTGRFRATGAIDIAPGDLLDVRFRGETAGGTGSLRIGNIQTGVRYDGNGYDVFAPHRSSATLQNYEAATYYLAAPMMNIHSATTSSFLRARFHEGTLRNLWAQVNNSGGAAGNYPVSVVQVNGVDSAADLTISAAAGNVRYHNALDEVAIADGDTIWFAFRTANFSQAISAWGFTIESNAAPPVVVDVPAGELEIEGGTPFVTADEFAYPEAGALTLAGGFPTVVLDLLISVPAGALEIEGGFPSIETGITIQPPAGALEILGGIPFVATDFQAVASQAAVLTLGEVQPDALASQAAVLALGEIVPDVAASQAAVLALVEAVPCVSRWSQCWLFMRTDGEEFAFTSHDAEVQFMGRTFEPCHSLQASATEAATDVGAVGNMELSGIIDAEAISEADLYAGKFDACRVEVWEVPWDASDGSIPRRLAAGQTGSVSHGRDGFRAEVLGIGALIQQQALTTVVSPACRWVFGDAATCGKDLGPLTEAGTVTAVGIAERRAFASASLAALALNDGYFSRGVLTFTTGENAGFKSEVKDFAGGSGVVILWNATPRPISAGDEFTVTPGCTLAADGDNGCKFWNNYVNFGGFPDVPGNDAISETPDAKY